VVKKATPRSRADGLFAPLGIRSAGCCCISSRETQNRDRPLFRSRKVVCSPIGCHLLGPADHQFLATSRRLAQGPYSQEDPRAIQGEPGRDPETDARGAWRDLMASSARGAAAMRRRRAARTHAAGPDWTRDPRPPSKARRISIKIEAEATSSGIARAHEIRLDQDHSESITRAGALQRKQDTAGLV